eukprot:3047838-Rhodomonas_salina.2
MSILATELGEQPPSTQERVFTEINALLSHTQDSTFEIGAAIEAKVLLTDAEAGSKGGREAGAGRETGRKGERQVGTQGHRKQGHRDTGTQEGRKAGRQEGRKARKTCSPPRAVGCLY